jgi:hypothetical protein
MFVGAVPRQAIEQVTRSVPFASWGDVFVGCSGSFRLDRAVHAVHPKLRVHSNDVSLLSCSMGAAAAGQPFDMRFTGRLAFIEEHLVARPMMARLAAIQVAQEMAKYRADNPFAAAHFEHYRARFVEFLDIATGRLETYMGHLAIESFHAGDFRDQAQRAKDAGGGIVAYPPTYKNGYENLFKFVDQNTEWERPAYRVWNPSGIESWIDELDALAVRYCVLTDLKLERHEPITAFYGVLKPVYAYANAGNTSVKRTSNNARPFAYKPVDADLLTVATKVEIIAASSAQMNFLKDGHLSKGIKHTDGSNNFLVFLDRCLAGGFILDKDKWDATVLYMLCDFSLSPKSRVSKLIAMLATSETVTQRLEVKFLQRIESLCTTAFTDNPVSMKYRGVWDLVARNPGSLQYASKVRRQTPSAIYAEWWERFVANARVQSGPRLPEAARQKRAIHEGAAV